MEPGVPQLGRQGAQPADVVGVGAHERLVVGGQRRDEAEIRRVLALAVDAVDEQAPDPAVSLSAGVHGEIDALGKVVDAAHAGPQPVHALLGLLRGLVHEQHVHLGALKAVRVRVIVAVAKEDAAAVGEDDVLLLVVIQSQALLAVLVVDMQQLAQRQDVVLLQLRIGLAHDHDLDPRVLEAQQRRFDAHGPALSPAPRAAVADIPVPVVQKPPLLLARPRDLQLRHFVLPGLEVLSRAF